MKLIRSPQDQGWNVEIINILKRLGSLRVEYPADLLTARRAVFVLHVKQQSSQIENDAPMDEEFIQHLRNLRSINMDYPLALRAARRAAFIDQIERYVQARSTEEQYSEDEDIIQVFESLKSFKAEYPPNLLAARRASFRRQIALGGRVSVLDALRNSIRSLYSDRIRMPSVPTMNTMRTSLVVMALMLAAYVGSLLSGPIQSASPLSPPGGFSQPAGILVATRTGGVARVVCKPGYLPPLCQEKALNESQDLAFQGNGSARPAVAKDALPDSSGIHKAAYVNDGLYGPRTSWISDSPYSWIKIDLGQTATINTVAFGKDRLGNSNEGDPGQFVIAVALSDNVYADGNSSNDYIEYTDVYNSQQAGFNGVISGPETILAQFQTVKARYIKITFTNPRTAVDEVQAFMSQSLAPESTPTKKPKGDDQSDSVPILIPTYISAPTKVATPVPTKTPAPVNTATPVPTTTPVPTDTPKPAPTDTPLPPPTDTPMPAPTDTPLPPPTDTPMPAPTDTPLPPPPPTETPMPAPTDTPLPPPPPTDTPMPAPTDAPPPSANLVQPTDTAAPAPATAPPSLPNLVQSAATSMPPAAAAPIAVPTNASSLSQP